MVYGSERTRDALRPTARRDNWRDDPPPFTWNPRRILIELLFYQPSEEANRNQYSPSVFSFYGNWIGAILNLRNRCSCRMMSSICVPSSMLSLLLLRATRPGSQQPKICSAFPDLSGFFGGIWSVSSSVLKPSRDVQRRNYCNSPLSNMFLLFKRLSGVLQKTNGTCCLLKAPVNRNIHMLTLILHH